MNRNLYFLFCGIFILYVAFAGFDAGANEYWNPYPLFPEMRVTVQYYFWLLFLRLAMFLIFLAWYYESAPENRKMLKILAIIHCWYLIEYVLHYTSVWIKWEGTQSGLSSHIVTMLCFAYFARGD